MKGFLRNTMWYLAGLLAINLVLYQIFFKPNLYEKYLQSLSQLKSEKHIPVLVLGDSHANAIPADYWPNPVFKRFCYPSDSYFDMYNKISYCIRRGIQIDRILLIADDHVVSDYRTRANNIETSILLSTFRTYKELLNFNRAQYLYMRYVKRYVPMMEASNSLLLYNFLEARMRTREYHYVEKQWAAYTPQEQEQSIQSRVKSQYAPAAKSLLACTDSILSMCRQHQIPVTGIVYPLSSRYRNRVDQMDYPSVSQRFLASGVPVLNFRSYFSDDRYFFDQDHVNDAGAKILADSVIHYLHVAIPAHVE